jgi:hypothetical protein
MCEDREAYDAYWALLEEGLVPVEELDDHVQYEDMEIPDTPRTDEEIAALPILNLDDFFKDRENNVEDAV